GPKSLVTQLGIHFLYNLRVEQMCSQNDDQPSVRLQFGESVSPSIERFSFAPQTDCPDVLLLDGSDCPQTNQAYSNRWPGSCFEGCPGDFHHLLEHGLNFICVVLRVSEKSISMSSPDHNIKLTCLTAKFKCLFSYGI